jgi:hypothetical protein
MRQARVGQRTRQRNFDHTGDCEAESATRANQAMNKIKQMSTLQVNADGFSTGQNVPAIIATRRNGTTIQGLLDNDHVSNAPNVKQSSHYQNRSCLCSYLLGYSTKKCQKTGKSCVKRATREAGNRREAQKRADLGRKSSHTRLFMGANSYEIYSVF